MEILIQGDLLGYFPLIWNLVDVEITQDAEIGVFPPRDTGRYYAPYLGMLQAAWQEGPQNEGNGANRAGGHRVSVAKFCFHM